jgi:type IV pilus assembly protein PilE
MTKKIYNGFTLIELLVVVLIIGILAAIAVPQYRISVLKSRYSALYVNLKSLAEAEERFYLENGQYTANMGDLDVFIADIKKITTTGNLTGSNYILLNAGRHNGQRVFGELPEGGGLSFILNNSDAPGSIECYTPNIAAPNKDSLYDKVCQSMGGIYLAAGGDGTARVYKIK